MIADLVRLAPGTECLYRRIAEKANADYTIPGSARTRIAAETIRHWLKRNRAGGFEALLPKPRADRGRGRKIPDEIAEKLIALKEQHHRLSIPALIRHARTTGRVPQTTPLAPSTVHRLLSREGLMQRCAEAPTDNDRRRFAFARTGELWMSDVMHGPSAVVRELRQQSARAKLAGTRAETLARLCGYFETHSHRMAYHECLAAGYTIASGIIEGACPHVVKDRVERSGMHWVLEGAHALLGLRTICLSGLWHEYMRFHIDRERQRLYPHCAANDPNMDLPLIAWLARRTGCTL